MNLEELTQPVIDYICEIRRVVRHGGQLGMNDARRNIMQRLEQMKELASDNQEMVAEVDKITLPLVFYIDYMIKEGPFSFKDAWEELARKYNELSGDEKFFDILDETLSDPSVAATERLKVLYQCVGSGFNGDREGENDYLERKMKVCALRIGISGDLTEKENVTPDCYETIANHDFFRDPTKSLKFVLAASMLIIIIAIAVNFVVFFRTINPLRSVLNETLSIGLETEVAEKYFSSQHTIHMATPKNKLIMKHSAEGSKVDSGINIKHKTLTSNRSIKKINHHYGNVILESPVISGKHKQPTNARKHESTSYANSFSGDGSDSHAGAPTDSRSRSSRPTDH